MLKTGAEIVAECLLEQGVNIVFGYPGGRVLDIYDALYKYGDKIRHITTCNEQGAAHAADGYARVTGKTGVVIATSGPGATNLVTGIAGAYMDSVPMVAITGNAPLSLLGKDSFQEVDIQGITMPITKHNFIVKDINLLADILRDAFRIAEEGRKGPVLVDIPTDIAAQSCDFVPGVPKPVLPYCKPKCDLEVAAKMISLSHRPVIFAGGGVVRSGATDALRTLSRKCGIPVCVSLMGLGCMEPLDGLYLGMLGMHGTSAAAEAVKNSDLIIAVGTRFSDRSAYGRDCFAPDALVLHIDIDPAEIDKNIKSDFHICTDAGFALTTICDLLSGGSYLPWENKIAEFKKQESSNSIRAAEIIKVVDKYAEDDITVVTDVGQHQMWTAKFLPIRRPGGLLTSGGLGAMGYGFGAALGAGVATGKRVVLITGDGSFYMNMGEIATAVSLGIDLTVIVMNNSGLGLVRQWQDKNFGGRHSGSDIKRGTDIPALAKAFGADGVRLPAGGVVEDVIMQVMSAKGVFIVDCEIPESDMVPMKMVTGHETGGKDE